MQTMEGVRSNSRVLINDRVFDKIQDQRYAKHLDALHHLKQPVRKSHTDYSASHITSKLDRYKRAQAHITQILQPRDIEFANCQKHIKQTQSNLRLPKITRNKPPENTLKQLEQHQRIDKQNNLLQLKINHLSLEKKRKHQEEIRRIAEYEKQRKLSRRTKVVQNSTTLSPEVEFTDRT